jgi:predicted ATPase
MIKSITFKEDYDLCIEKETQKRFPVKHIIPTRYMREKKPFDMFTLFPKGLKIEFQEGINVIVGENGSGKTTLIYLIKEYSGKPYEKMGLLMNDEYENEDDYFIKYQKKYKGILKVNGVIHYRNAVYFSGEEDNPVVAIPKMVNPMNENFISLSAQLFFAQEESHGESMLPLLEYILKNAKDCVIFMDEPETALSLKNQFWLVNEMQKSAKERNNQIIISTHALALISQFETIFDMETRQWVNREKYINEIISI